MRLVTRCESGFHARAALLTVRSNAMITDEFRDDVKEMRNNDFAAVADAPPMVDIPFCSAFVQRDPHKYTPPAQLMAREWSLIFARTELTKRDLDRLNISCNFFRTYVSQRSWRGRAVTDTGR